MVESRKIFTNYRVNYYREIMNNYYGLILTLLKKNIYLLINFFERSEIGLRSKMLTSHFYFAPVLKSRSYQIIKKYIYTVLAFSHE